MSPSYTNAFIKLKSCHKRRSQHIQLIYIAGDYDQARNACKHFCNVMCMDTFSCGLCVTVTQTSFIYTGGEEYGIRVGLVNYPRFPVSEEKLLSIAHQLADYLRSMLYQKSYLIITPADVIWDSNQQM